MAVLTTGNALTFANALARFETLRAGHNQLAVAATGGVLMHRIARIAAIGRHAERTRPVWKATALLTAGMALSAAGITYAVAFSDDDKAVQTAQPAQAKDTPDPFTLALKAAVRNGSMAEEHAIQIYSFLTKGVPGSNKRGKTVPYLEEVAAKLDAMVMAGMLSAEAAEGKMIALEQQIASKEQHASGFREELASRMQNDRMSKTEAYLELAAEKLDEIVMTGELTAEDAEARLNAIEKRIVFGQVLASKMENEGKTKSEAYLELTAAKLGAMVLAGELSAEDAEAKMIALEQEIAVKEIASRMENDGESKTDAYLEQVAAELDAMVKAGKLSAEDAEAKLIAIENSIAAKSKSGSGDARTVLRAAKRVDLNRDQKDEIREIERGTIGAYRRISRKNKEGHTELAEQVKAEITKLLDAEQIEQFEAALKRLGRGNRRVERKQLRQRGP